MTFYEYDQYGMPSDLVVKYVNPDEVTEIPWVPNCPQCGDLYTDPQPGLGAWVMAVGTHMENAHRIELRTRT